MPTSPTFHVSDLARLALFSGAWIDPLEDLVVPDPEPTWSTLSGLWLADTLAT